MKRIVVTKIPTKSSFVIKMAKKRGLKVRSIKLRKMNTRDLHGFPVPQDWIKWANGLRSADQARWVRDFNYIIHGPLWFWV